MNSNHSKIALASDSLEDLVHALRLPLPDKMHIDCIKISLPYIIQDIRNGIIAQTGENPWAADAKEDEDDEN